MIDFGSRPSKLRLSLVLLLITAADVYAEIGPLEIRITDHKPGIDQFQSLNVTLDRISLHQKGFGRNKGWISFAPEPAAFTAIDIVPLKDGRYQSLGEGQLPVGPYDAIKINFSSAVGRLKSNAYSLVRANDTTLATAITVNSSSNSSIVIDLYAEDQTEHDPPRYVVKVKEIRIVNKNQPANQTAD